VTCDERHPSTFPLRLAGSLRNAAHDLAAQDGVSLNHFISLAVAEKISRLESDELKRTIALAAAQPRISLTMSRMSKGPMARDPRF
jgi:hypothetical protein